MKIINVKAEHNYQVEIGVEFSSAIKQICNNHRKVLLLAPASLIKLFKVKESKSLFLLPTPNGESQKSAQFLDRIWRKAASIGLERSDPLLDLAGELLPMLRALRLQHGLEG